MTIVQTTAWNSNSNINTTSRYNKATGTTFNTGGRDDGSETYTSSGSLKKKKKSKKKRTTYTYKYNPVDAKTASGSYHAVYNVTTKIMEKKAK